jgi:tRNA (cytidine/uridine-2'-O-)-methyltransferase
LFSARGTTPYTVPTYQPGDVLVFGRETTGLPRELVEAHGAYTIPMTGPIRSLNLSNAVAVVTYNALADVQPELFRP